MTEEKSKRAKRPKDEVMADLKARLARHEWSGPKQALKLVHEASELIAEAEEACGDKAKMGDMWKAVQQTLRDIDTVISKAIPPEAKT